MARMNSAQLLSFKLRILGGYDPAQNPNKQMPPITNTPPRRPLPLPHNALFDAIASIRRPLLQLSSLASHHMHLLGKKPLHLNCALFEFLMACLIDSNQWHDPYIATASSVRRKQIMPTHCIHQSFESSLRIPQIPPSFNLP